MPDDAVDDAETTLWGNAFKIPAGE